MRVLIWHVHGSWMTSFVQGSHTYLIPAVADRGPDGRGRAQTWSWPASAEELTPDELADAAVDVLVIQRKRDLELAEKWLGGRRPGRDIATVWVEHDLPRGPMSATRHPSADRGDVAAVVHVTHTNALYWDTGATPTRVIEHGVIDPGRTWTGERPAVGAVINEPVRRGRLVGTDLLPAFGAVAHVDVFGMGVDELAITLDRPAWLDAYEDLGQHDLHRELATRRCYLHPYRWTSLGLALIEAMHLGMPVVALATTDAPRAVPPGCGVVSNRLDELLDGVERLMVDRDLAERLGAAARSAAVDRYGLERFLSDWNDLLEGL